LNHSPAGKDHRKSAEPSTDDKKEVNPEEGEKPWWQTIASLFSPPESDSQTAANSAATDETYVVDPKMSSSRKIEQLFNNREPLSIEIEQERTLIKQRSFSTRAEDKFRSKSPTRQTQTDSEGFKAGPAGNAVTADNNTGNGPQPSKGCGCILS